MLAAAFLITAASACGGAASTPAPAAPAAPAAAPQTDSASPTAVSTDSSAPASSDAPLKIESYKLMQDNGSGAAGDEVKSFKPANHVQYFTTQLSAFLKPGAKVKWIFTAVDTTAGKDVKITEADTTAVVANNLTSNLSLTKDFPVGKYKADITIDGAPLGPIEYTVAE